MVCLLRWTAFLWTLNSIPCTFGMALSEQTDGSCPPLSVEEHRFSDILDRPLEITGFDLTEKFLLRKGTITEYLPSFRLGSSPLIKPTKSVFPNGLSSEYSLVSIFRVRRTTKKDRWYLFQIFDQSGGSQVSVVVDGGKKAVEFSSQGLAKNTPCCTFKKNDLHPLFDRQWHKLSISVQSNMVSIYMDCKLIERRRTDEKDTIDLSGRTLITTRVEDGRPVDIELRQILIYCDPYIAELENCCELLEPKCEAKKTFNGTSPPLVTEQLPQMLSQPVSQSIDRCHCPAEKGDAGLPEVVGVPGQKGDKGDKGDTGDAGPQGNQGHKVGYSPLKQVKNLTFPQENLDQKGKRESMGRRVSKVTQGQLVQLVPRETKVKWVSLELRCCLLTNVPKEIRALEVTKEIRDWLGCQVSQGNQAKRAKGDGEERLGSLDPEACL
ncbi:collagen alpha-1(XIX) chain-like [Seriola dumerili]|uniref:collagen alpha-1(XIX) chain-like n=1 Tax=Seriola dumerili TaxID=41447 RepID=UPI000BBE4D42|nr:collagen alpha-1(XIX) chain-like [Seriola dumerili]